MSCSPGLARGWVSSIAYSMVNPVESALYQEYEEINEKLRQGEFGQEGVPIIDWENFYPPRQRTLISFGMSRWITSRLFLETTCGYSWSNWAREGIFTGQDALSQYPVEVELKELRDTTNYEVGFLYLLTNHLLGGAGPKWVSVRGYRFLSMESSMLTQTQVTEYDGIGMGWYFTMGISLTTVSYTHLTLPTKA